MAGDGENTGTHEESAGYEILVPEQLEPASRFQNCFAGRTGPFSELKA
jgi:hypothetical protein